MLASGCWAQNSFSACNLGKFDRFADAWLECLRRVVRDGHDITDDGRDLRELLNVSITAFSCTADDFIAAGASSERIALMVAKYEQQAVLPGYRIDYGSLFRAHAGVDQISWLLRKLRSKPETKSATIGFHVPGSAELSCISLVDCKLRDSLLHVNAVFRSQNVYGSQPGNVVALSRLHHRLARELQVGIGYLTLHVLSAHVYSDDLASVAALLEETVRGTEG